MLLLASILVLTSAFLHVLPRLTRPGLFFAVHVDPEFCAAEEARRITRVYRSIVWSFALVSLAVLLTTGRPETIVLQVAGYYCAMAVAHRRALAHAAVSDSAIEVNLAAPRESLPGGLPAMFAPPALTAALALWASRHWDRLPERFPVHWGMHGADRWLTRTPAGVYGWLAFNAAMSLLFVLLGAGILYWSRRTSAGGSAALEERRFRRMNVLIFLALACLPAAQGWIILLQPPAVEVWLIGAALLIGAIYYALLIRNRPRLSARVGDHTPDRCWKLGIFYFNPSDPAVFVLQRFGIGYTFNFGNRWSWAALGSLLAAVSLRVVLR